MQTHCEMIVPFLFKIIGIREREMNSPFHLCTLLGGNALKNSKDASVIKNIQHLYHQQIVFQ